MGSIRHIEQNTRQLRETHKTYVTQDTRKKGSKERQISRSFSLVCEIGSVEGEKIEKLFLQLHHHIIKQQASKSKTINYIMSSVQFHMSDAVQRGAEHGMRIGMEAAMKSVLEEVVNKLSEKYEFDAEEAMEFLGVVTFKKPKKSKKVQLPWCGMVILNCCQALKVNKGLHSQCLNDKVEEGEFCKSCQKDADKNGGTPSKGTASARIDPDYTDAKGKAPVNYGNYMKKEGITREAAEAEAAKWGVTIPEEQFLVVDTKKGRKKKDASSDTETEDTASEAGSVSEPETEETASEAGSVSEPETDETASDTGSISEPEEPVEQEPVEQEPVEQEQEQEPVEQEPVEQEPVEQEPVEQEPVEDDTTSETETASDTETKPKAKTKSKARGPKHFTGTRDEWNAMNKDEQNEWKKQNPSPAEAEKAEKARVAAEKKAAKQDTKNADKKAVKQDTKNADKKAGKKAAKQETTKAKA
jgi:hypothetical protein